MLLFQQYPFFHFLAIIPFATAQRVLPVGEIQSAALVELHEVIISPHEGLKKRGAVPQPRKYYPPKPQRDADSSPAMVKRTLLGGRQLVCDAGYGLCQSL